MIATERLDFALFHPYKGLKLKLKSEPSTPKAPTAKKNIIPKGLIVQRSTTANPEIRKRLTIRNEKYFSSVQACDEECVSTTRSIRRSKGVKLLRSFAFDSSKCEESGINELHKLLYKLPIMKKLDFTIDKVNYRNEVAAIGTAFSRLIRLNSLNLGLIKVANISNYAILKLLYGTRNCQLIKNFKLRSILLPEMTYRGCKKGKDRLRTMKKLEKLSLTFSKRAVMNDQLIESSLPKLPKLKEIYYYLIKDSAWTLQTLDDESHEFLTRYLSSFGSAINPIRFHFTFDDYAITPENIAALLESLCKMPDLKNVSLDFTNCKLGDLEMEYLSALLSQLKNLENLEISIKERSNIHPNIIFQFIKDVTQHTGIKNVKIDVAVKFLFKQDSQMMGDRIATLSDISSSFIDNILSVTKGELYQQ